MKKALKIMAAVVLVAAMVFSIASCGVDMNKIKGDWTVSTVEGKSPLDYAKENGGETMVFALLNYTITETQFTEKLLDISGEGQSKTYDIAVKSNGFEVMNDGSVDRSVAYDDKADSLSFRTNVNTDDGKKVVTVVLKRGSADIDALINEAFAGAESGDESGEEE